MTSLHTILLLLTTVVLSLPEASARAGLETARAGLETARAGLETGQPGSWDQSSDAALSPRKTSSHLEEGKARSVRSIEASDLIAAQLDLQSSRNTSLRARGCTNDYEFTYVKPGSSIYFRNHLKKYKGPKNTICGWWFWTEVNNNLELKCEFIDLRDQDYMVIYDMDGKMNYGKSGVEDISDYERVFESSNLAVGLETTEGREERTFQCEIFSLHNTYGMLMGGVTTQFVGLETNVTLISPLPATIVLPEDFSEEDAVAMFPGTVVICSSRKTEEKNSSCTLQNVNTVGGNTSTELLDITGLDIPIHDNPIFLFMTSENIWLLSDTKLIPFFFDSPSLDLAHTGPPACAAGDLQHRFYVLPGSSEVYYNTNILDPKGWTKVDIPNRPSTDLCCFYDDEKFYIVAGIAEEGGNHYLSKEVSVVHAGNLIVTSLPDLNYAVKNCAMGIVDDKIAVIGGILSSDEDGVVHNPTADIPTADAQLFDPDTNSWITRSGYLHVPIASSLYLKTRYFL